MAKVVVVGGGWAGCAAALSAKKAGAEVVLLEKTDCLLGTGLVGGIMRNNGRFTAAEEMIALGGGDLFQLTDKTSRHVNIEFPGHKHASLYDVALMEPTVARYLAEKGVEVWTVSRARKIKMTGQKIEAVQLETGQLIEGDVFVDATGTLGPQGNCRKYGNGCAMCILRCPSFGGRVSIAGLAGVKEMMGRRPDGGYGAMSGSCKINKDSLDPGLVAELERTGVAVVPVPKELAEQKSKLLGIKSCQQYALKEFADNVVLLDTGHVKLMSPFYPLADLRSIPGLENARYEDPYAGGMGNSIRYLAMSPRDDFLKVEGMDNLFCCGEKAGLLVGHTEAITTGTLAGHNAVRYVMSKPLLELPLSLAVGDAIAYVREQMQTEEGLMQKYTFSGSVYFEQMKELGLYTTDVNAIRERVKEAGLSDVFAQQVL
ncbi:MAG: FAD-dependent oxidoreductase [Anaerolineales bacterium]|nr:MAG: FAD-dependent oxidoreductase [Anaerolineales bacterium]